MAVATQPATRNAVPAPRPPAATNRRPRGDALALALGILFSALFTGLIGATGGRLNRREIKTEDIYRWQSRRPTLAAHLTAWGGYLAHQLFQWGTIYYAQTRVRRYARGLHPINLVALIGNACFVALHYVQSHLWYDGLASKVSVWSSQSSVIAMLVMILAMENPRRGTVFGVRAPFPRKVINFLRKYHGYYISWATVYTFWYHPMATNRAHLSGFIYMFLLMVQGSLFFTRVHLNRWWTLVQELMVIPHAILTATLIGPGSWPRFAFGFAWMFVITQLHGLGLSLKTRLAMTAAAAAATVAFYRDKPLKRLNEVVGIPMIELLSMGLLAAFVAAGLRIQRPRATTPEPLPTRPFEDDVLEEAAA